VRGDRLKSGPPGAAIGEDGEFMLHVGRFCYHLDVGIYCFPYTLDRIFLKHALQAKENKRLSDVILSSRVLFEGLTIARGTLARRVCVLSCAVDYRDVR
jgi:hypothetical protein